MQVDTYYFYVACEFNHLISLDDAGEAPPAPRHTDLVKLAQECCYHSNLAVAAHGITVLTSITVSCPQKGWFLLTTILI